MSCIAVSTPIRTMPDESDCMITAPSTPPVIVPMPPAKDVPPLDLEQAGANREAIGAWVEVRIGDRTIQREVTVGGGHASGQLGWIHVGLGTADSAEVRVTWPDGDIGPWTRLPADGFTLLDRDAATATPWTP